MILDYELGEISRQYFTDEIDEVDGRIEAPRIISGNRLWYHLFFEIKYLQNKHARLHFMSADRSFYGFQRLNLNTNEIYK